MQKPDLNANNPGGGLGRYYSLQSFPLKRAIRMPMKVVFTICNSAYLPYALECERTFSSEHGEDWSFLIFLVDHPRLLPSELKELCLLLAGELSKIYCVSELFRESKELSLMSLYYDITEYSTAVKPWIFSYILDRLAPDSVTYIDPDIQFFGSLDKSGIFDDAGFDCVVTPHVLTDSLNAYQQPTLLNIRSCGSYNFGFVHFFNTEAANTVIQFWKRELVFDAMIAFEENLFTDQRFGDLFPSLCNVKIERNPGLNIAYWNLQERLVHKSRYLDKHEVLLIRSDGKILDQRPLTFFHYSSLRVKDSIGISKHGGRQPRSARGGNKTIEKLIANYLEALKLYRAKLGEVLGSNRVDLIGACNLAVLGGNEAPFLLSHRQRVQLNHFLKERSNAGMPVLPPSRFIDERSFMLSLHGLPAEKASMIIRSELNVFGAIGLQLPHVKLLAADAGAEVRKRTAKINVVGYPNFSFGIGKITSLILKGLSAAGIHFSFIADPAQAKPFLDSDMEWISALPGLSAFDPLAPSLFLVNADQLLQYANTGIAEHCFSRVMNIGYWWWELENPVKVHAQASRLLDKVFAPTRFIYDSLTLAVPTSKLVYAPLDYHKLYESLQAKPEDLEEPSDQQFIYSMGLDLELDSFRTKTLMVFDFHSCIYRKNPDLLVGLFASSRLREHALLIKCSGGAAMAHQYGRLIERIASLSNVFLLDRRLSDSDLQRLFRICQLYASPHRAEGLGLNIIEADAQGLTTVSTGYGGILDYPFYGVGPHFGCPYNLVEVTPDSAVYASYIGKTKLKWADPSPDAFEQALWQGIKQVMSPSTEVSSPSGLKTSFEVVQLRKPATSLRQVTIITVLQELLASEMPVESCYRGLNIKEPRTPASLAAVPTSSEAKRQLFLAFRQVLISGKQSLNSVHHLVNVVRLVSWLYLRRFAHVRIMYKAVLSRRHYLRRPPSFRQLDTPPVDEAHNS